MSLGSNLVFSSAYLLVTIGGALGSLARFIIVNRFILISQSSGFPIGTLAVNVFGSFLMGLLIGAVPEKSSGFVSGPLYWFFAVGFLGGLTTFSSFALDVLSMFYSTNKFALASYILVSLIGSIASCFLGFFLSRSIF